MRLILITSFIALLLDQITKYFFENKTIVVTSFFKFDYVTNTGAAFGMLKGFNILFIVVAFLVIFLMLKYYKKEIKKEKPYVHLGVGFLLGGLLGNLSDRISYGYVRDFIDFSFWPTFNLADSFVTVAIVLLSIHIFTKK